MNVPVNDVKVVIRQDFSTGWVIDQPPPFFIKTGFIILYYNLILYDLVIFFSSSIKSVTRLTTIYFDKIDG